jgi:hypothetical protein
MSTKIYYGFQVATSDPKVILNLVQEYREKYWVSDAVGVFSFWFTQPD